MTNVLFRPFDFKKWLVLGFTAFLAGLASQSRTSHVSGSGEDVEDLGESAQALWDTFVEASVLAVLGALGCVILVVLLVALIWLSSRGKFMFLDNVVHNRARVVDPWKRFRRQGDSLFLFTLAFVFGCVAAGLALVVLVAATIGLGGWSEIETASTIAAVVASITVFALLVVVLLFGSFFLGGFVVPLMHRYEVGVLDGWRRFFEIFSQYPWAFVVCGLLVLVASIGVMVGVVAFGLMTCCLGFLLLVIPYVGSVVTLPVSVFYRSFTYEFLAQFDPELVPSVDRAVVD